MMTEKARAVKPNASKNRLTNLSFLILDILSFPSSIPCLRVNLAVGFFF